MYFLKVLKNLNPENRLKDLSELEKIDYRNISIIENVIENEVVAEALSIDMLENSDDKDRVTKLQSLEELKNFIGDGVYIKENEPSRIYAQKSGQIVFKDGKFHVNDKITLDEVSFKTGNVTFVGDLVVEGDIKPGFIVNARNLLVKGSVDNSQLIAGETVVVKGGVIGLQNKDFCKIRAGKLVVLNFIENSDIECDGPVYIKKSAMHTNIFAKGRIVLFGEPGLVVGGEVIAEKNMIIKVVGSKWGTKTILKVGIDPFKYLRLKQAEQRFQKNSKLLEEVNKSIDYINSVLEGKGDTEDKEKLKKELEEIIKKRDKFEKKIKRVSRIIQRLKEKIQEEKEKLDLDNTKIFIFKKIYPGVEFRIGLEHHRVYDEMAGSVVFMENDEVKFKSIKN